MDWKGTIEFLIPAEGESHHRAWYAWAGFGIVSFWFFFWWSVGLMPEAFGAGFARAEEAKFNTQMLLEQRLSTVKQRQCMATDQESRTYWTEELSRLSILYKEKLGDDYREPPCSTLIAPDQ